MVCIAKIVYNQNTEIWWLQRCAQYKIDQLEFNNNKTQGLVTKKSMLQSLPIFFWRTWYLVTAMLNIFTQHTFLQFPMKFPPYCLILHLFFFITNHVYTTTCKNISHKTWLLQLDCNHLLKNSLVKCDAMYQEFVNVVEESVVPIPQSRQRW
jgi:hypothetical protein